MPFVSIRGRALNYEWIGSPCRTKPTVVFLHEGLGSISQWKNFPHKICQETGLPGLMYERYGYGQSDVLEAPRTARFMHEEAIDVLPAVLNALGVERPLLIGHSDGASIALIHAGAGYQVEGVVAIAPHVTIEPVCIDGIAAAVSNFESGSLATRLQRHHKNAAATFYGWANVFMNPSFEGWDIRDDYVAKIFCPVLAIQGDRDPYGTMAQVDDIALRTRGPCKLLKLADCGHIPFQTHTAQVESEIRSFVESLMKQSSRQKWSIWP